MTRSYGIGLLIFLEVRVILGLTGVAKYGPGAVGTVLCDVAPAGHIIWICTACSLFVADLVLQLQEVLQRRPITAKAQAAWR